VSRDIESHPQPEPEREPGRSRLEERSPETSAPASRARAAVELRGYRYQISPAEVETLREIGRFRTVRIEDLERYHYQGRTPEMQEDLASLRDQGLLQRRTATTRGRGDKITVVVLTKLGKSIIENQGSRNSSDRIYSGFVKPAEAGHDAAIYPMYQAEAAKIACAGGRIRSVVLDYELKQRVYTPLAKAKASAMSPREYARRQAEVAGENNLKVVRGRILLPDLRIEYDTQDGTRAHVDLELATDHYRGAHLRGKAEAGFKMYAPQDSVARLAAAFDPEFVAEIFSL
jgi:hypothetical protein